MKMNIMEQITLKSDKKNLSLLLSNLEKFLDGYDLSMKFKLNLELVIEELFINICSYAYADEGDISIQWYVEDDPSRLIIHFRDEGVQFNPLEKEAPDLTLDAKDREIGGLGLTLVKTNVDDIGYSYENGHNILTIEKNF